MHYERIRGLSPLLASFASFAFAAAALAGSAACHRAPADDAPRADGGARTIADGGAVASDAAAEAAAPVYATQDEERAWKQFARELGDARVAMHEKRWDDAIAACDRALALEPRHPLALLERGTARVGMKKLDDARLDLESARERATRDELAAKIDFQLGMARDALGDQEGARAAFAAVQAIRPGAAAGTKLIDRSACDADVDRRAVPATRVAGWLAAWKAIAADYARDHGDALAVRPATTDDEARAALCAHGCDGDGPWIAGYGADEKELSLIVAQKSGLGVFLRIGRSRGGACASEDLVKIDTSSSPAHLVVQSLPSERVFMHENAIHDWVECDSTLGGCQPECRTFGFADRDWWIDLASATRVLAVERVGRVVSGGHEPRAQLAQKNGTVFILGDGCDEKIPLPK